MYILYNGLILVFTYICIIFEIIYSGENAESKKKEFAQQVPCVKGTFMSLQRQTEIFKSMELEPSYLNWYLTIMGVIAVSRRSRGNR